MKRIRVYIAFLLIHTLISCGGVCSPPYDLSPQTVVFLEIITPSVLLYLTWLLFRSELKRLQ